MSDTDHEDSDLLDVLAEVALNYPPGVLPGLHPIELMTAAELGFTPFQARQTLEQPELMQFLHLHWLQCPPTPELRAQAAGQDIRAELHRALLARHEAMSERHRPGDAVAESDSTAIEGDADGGG